MIQSLPHKIHIHSDDGRVLYRNKPYDIRHFESYERSHHGYVIKDKGPVCMQSNGLDEHYIYGLGQILYYRKYGPNAIGRKGDEMYHSSNDFKVSMANKTIYVHRQSR